MFARFFDIYLPNDSPHSIATDIVSTVGNLFYQEKFNLLFSRDVKPHILGLDSNNKDIDVRNQKSSLELRRCPICNSIGAIKCVVYSLQHETSQNSNTQLSRKAAKSQSSYATSRNASLIEPHNSADGNNMDTTAFLSSHVEKGAVRHIVLYNILTCAHRNAKIDGTQDVIVPMTHEIEFIEQNYSYTFLPAEAMLDGLKKIKNNEANNKDTQSDIISGTDNFKASELFSDSDTFFNKHGSKDTEKQRGDIDNEKGILERFQKVLQSELPPNVYNEASVLSNYEVLEKMQVSNETTSIGLGLGSLETMHSFALQRRLLNVVIPMCFDYALRIAKTTSGAQANTCVLTYAMKLYEFEKHPIAMTTRFGYIPQNYSTKYGSPGSTSLYVHDGEVIDVENIQLNTTNQIKEAREKEQAVLAEVLSKLTLYAFELYRSYLIQNAAGQQRIPIFNYVFLIIARPEVCRKIYEFVHSNNLGFVCATNGERLKKLEAMIKFRN